MKETDIVAGRIVLVGGGHTHVHLVETFGKAPLVGWRVLLVSPEPKTAYSGMLPGVIAGHYRREALEIDLVRLCTAYGIDFRLARAVGIDRAGKRLLLEDGSQVTYDLLSLDVGSVPAADGIAGAVEHGLPVKPIADLLDRLAAPVPAARDEPKRITVVGGGAAGVEIVLALRHRHAGTSLALVSAGPLLEGHPPGVRRQFRHILARRAVDVEESQAVAAIGYTEIELADGRRLESDLTLLATGAVAPAWLAQTGLRLANGFVAVRPTLQTISDPDIFAAGDCATIVGSERPKAGVFAVRAGPPLAVNLRAHAQGKPLRPWSPQKTYLALMATGGRHAVASRGAFFVSGRWVWLLKDWIDRSWLRRYTR
jgi:selenide, water dikinase